MCQRIGILVGNGGEQEHFKDLMCEKRACTLQNELLSHTVSVAGVDLLGMMHEKPPSRISQYSLRSGLTWPGSPRENGGGVTAAKRPDTHGPGKNRCRTKGSRALFDTYCSTPILHYSTVCAQFFHIFCEK